MHGGIDLPTTKHTKPYANVLTYNHTKPTPFFTPSTGYHILNKLHLLQETAVKLREVLTFLSRDL
jgi:hypothetical protein